MGQGSTACRRHSRRFEVRLPVLIFLPGSTIPLEAESRDISTTGFMCMLKEPLSIGQVFRCLLFISKPICDSGEAPRNVCLEAEAEVVRILVDSSDVWFGIGCRILSYKLISTEVGTSSRQIVPFTMSAEVDPVLQS